MQIPRDLSRRMLEAVEQIPIVDIHERLLPESRRVSQRFDFIAWFLAYAGAELESFGSDSDGRRSLDLVRQDLAVLGNVNVDPDERWALFSAYWPYVRTTGTGRVVLRAMWDLFGFEDVNERTWRDISAQLWEASEAGFYCDLLRRRANVSMTFVSDAAGLPQPVDPGTRSCCVPVRDYDRILTIRDQADLDEVVHRSAAPGNPLSGSNESCATLEQLDGLLEELVRHDAQECVSFKLSALPDAGVPSLEEVGWAFGRVCQRVGDTAAAHAFDGREVSAGEVEPALHSYLIHRFLTYVTQSGRPVQVHVADNTMVERLNTLAGQYPQVRFVSVYDGKVDAFALLTLARTWPNVSLAMGDLWRIAPRLARQSLMVWIQGVPLHKLFAFSGNTTVVEAVCAQAWIAREQIATMFSEMIADGMLDEEDALLAMKKILYENAQELFDFS